MHRRQHRVDCLLAWNHTRRARKSAVHSGVIGILWDSSLPTARRHASRRTAASL